ncbi:MAG: YgaP-like transmembrane domain [Pseudomonadota bacterium]
MKFEKNVGKKEGLLRIVVGILLLLLMIVLDGWLRWVSGLIGISLIATALAGT